MRVITLSRQFGSGGSEIAKRVSEKLGIKYADKSILAEAAAGSGIAKEHCENADERRTNSFLFSLAAAHYAGSAASIQINDIITDDKLFIHTADAIKRLAGEPCIIVGRCADDILSDRPILRVFVYASLQSRIARIGKLYDLSDKAAATLIKKTNKKRANYYNFYTSKTWGEAQNYDLCINSDALGIEGTADTICGFAAACEKQKEN